MKPFRLLLTLLLFASAGACTIASATTYPFEVTVSGQGSRAVILIPGFASSGQVWDETRKVLEPDFRCYTLTMAGFAGTSPQLSSASFRQWEDQIADYIKVNNISKPVIIGHSMGGGLALAIAADYPELAGKIVVVDALPCLAAIMNPGFQSRQPNDCSGIIRQITGMTDEQFRQMQQRSMNALMTDSIHRQQVLNWSLSSDRATFATMYCDFSNTDLREKTARISCPALILLEPSFNTMKEQVEQQYRGLRTADLRYAGKGLHFIMYDDYDWYIAQLRLFLTTK